MLDFRKDMKLSDISALARSIQNHPDLALPVFTIWPLGFVIGSFLLFPPLIIQSKNVDAICDFQAKTLDPQRVQAA